MAGNRHKEHEWRKHTKDRNRHPTEAAVRKFISTGVLRVPPGIDFQAFVIAAQRAENVPDVHKPEYRRIGRLKFDIIASVLGVLPKTTDATNEFDDPEWVMSWEQRRHERVQAALKMTRAEDHTAERFFLSELAVFVPNPWDIPFSTVKFVTSRAENGDFSKARKTFSATGSENLIQGALNEDGGHKKLRLLWESYIPNRDQGINIAHYYEKFPPVAGQQMPNDRDGRS